MVTTYPNKFEEVNDDLYSVSNEALSGVALSKNIKEADKHPKKF